MSAAAELLRTRTGVDLSRSDLRDLSWTHFAAALLEGVAAGQRVVAYFGTPEGDAHRLYLVLADDARAEIAVGTTLVEGGSFLSLTRDCPQVQLFEREIAEQLGIQAEGHPWAKAVRFAPPLPRPGEGAPKARSAGAVLPGVVDFYRVEGEQVHEVGVGPVHAGVIEPGHFRFQCHGETVFHLEISLGYQHRGVERALLGGPDRRSLHYLETVAGDTTIGHATAYCETLEALGESPPPARGSALRGVALEVERLANHIGDLGALSGDVAYLPTASYCGRIRGDFLNLTAELCGSRFGRGLVRPGGTGFDVDAALAARLAERLERAMIDSRSAVDLLWDAPSVMERFEGTGTVPREIAARLGLKGIAARASGLDRDARRDHPSGIFRYHQIPVVVADSGDVYARAHLRWLEIERSVAFVAERLASLPDGPARLEPGALRPGRLAVSLVEGWRGEICHVALTDERGRFERYKIVDPSFHNWSALAWALRGGQISDFPLCNKSFNLSYSGHDL